MFSENLIVKCKYNLHTKFIYDSYKNHGLNPYDTIYSYAKNVNAVIHVLEDYVDEDGFSYPTLKFIFKDESKAIMTKDSYKMIEE